MILIGERINGQFKDMREAIQTNNAEIIKKWAIKQAEAGADYLDVNTGTATATPKDTIAWMINTVLDTINIPIAIDSPKLEVVESGLKVCKERGAKVLINSTTGQREKLEKYFPLAKEYDASIICLTMDERGIPKDVNMRVEVAANIIATAMEYDIPIEKIFLDPIALPVKHAQQQIIHIFEAVKNFMLISSPAPHIVVGLSNVGQGTLEKELVNRTFLVMGMINGLDAAIVDVCDEELVNAVITTELILNKQIYSDSFLQAYKASKQHTKN